MFYETKCTNDTIYESSNWNVFLNSRYFDISCNFCINTDGNSRSNMYLISQKSIKYNWLKVMTLNNEIFNESITIARQRIIYISFLKRQNRYSNCHEKFYNSRQRDQMIIYWNIIFLVPMVTVLISINYVINYHIKILFQDC